MLAVINAQLETVKVASAAAITTARGDLQLWTGNSLVFVETLSLHLT